MANDFLISKWKMWYSWFDHDKDGNVNTADLERARYLLTNKRNDNCDRVLNILKLLSDET
jgi:Ca2+-binding EF-hand superfamily protein